MFDDYMFTHCRYSLESDIKIMKIYYFATIAYSMIQSTSQSNVYLDVNSLDETGNIFLLKMASSILEGDDA